MDAKTLTAKLIAIPSFVNANQGEEKLADFICAYFSKILPEFKIYKQKVEGKRYNVIAYNSDQPKLIFSSHMDTVLATGILKERLTPGIKNDRLYGLGSVDMKAGLACSIAATESAKKGAGDLPPMALMFTCGEEYYFEGIKTFLRDIPFKKGFKPELVVYPEPSNLEISNGCRGCVELEFSIKGKSAHAGRPQAGINAIEQAVKLVDALKLRLQQNCQPELGVTTVNLAGLIGGLELDEDIGIRANAIADTARVVLDIRTSAKEQTAEFILKIVAELAQVMGLGLKNEIGKLDLQPFILPKNNLQKMEMAIKYAELAVSYRENLGDSGIGEFSILGAELGWNAINFGPGPGNVSHKINEYVELKTIDQTVLVFTNLINSFKS